ncbi:MAG: cytochrome c oxidase subunit II [Candidatus Omnitrophica bacterium]|nr:cytochrome c oxidase subunit II [Candidatus Omnitrophota bacterium]
MSRGLKIPGILFLLLAGFSVHAHASIWGMPFPEDISTNGHLIDDVIRYIDKVLVIFFGAVAAAIIYFIIRYRSRPGHQAVYETGNKKVYVIATILLGMTVFFSIDAVIEHMSFRDLNGVFWNFPQGKNVLKIEVMPQQFAWNIRYAGTDGEFATQDDIVAPLSQMHVPVDTPVLLQLSAFDVVHAFYVPYLRIKQDVVPGMITTFWFQAKKTGKFEIACSALCGNGHYKMRGDLIVESKEDFQKWLDAQAAQASSPDDVWADSGPSTGGVPKDWGWKWQARI